MPDLTHSIRLWAKGEAGRRTASIAGEATQLSEVTDVILDAKLGLQQRQRQDRSFKGWGLPAPKQSLRVQGEGLPSTSPKMERQRRADLPQQTGWSRKAWWAAVVGEP